MEEITDRKGYLKATQLTDGIAVLEGTATWCSQCKAIAPFVDQVSDLVPSSNMSPLTVQDDQEVPGKDRKAPRCKYTAG